MSSSSAHWEKFSTKVFINLCLEEIEGGGKVRKTITSKSLASICIKFNEIIGKEFTKKQMKNKWDALSTDWKCYQKLLRESIGLGFEAETGRIIADDEWWNDKIKMDRKFAKFKDKGLDFHQDMVKLFDWTAVTGQYRFSSNTITPSSSSAPGLEDFENEDENDNIPFNAPQEIPSVETSEYSMGKGIKRKSSNRIAFDEGVSKLVGAIQNSGYSAVISKEESEIEEAVQLIKSLPIEEDLQWYALDKAIEAKWRKLFMAIKDPEYQARWLRYYQRKHDPAL